MHSFLAVWLEKGKHRLVVTGAYGGGVASDQQFTVTRDIRMVRGSKLALAGQWDFFLAVIQLFFLFAYS